MSVDTSGKIATVALCDDGRLILELAGDETKKHAETLLPLVERLLSDTQTAKGKIDLFGVDIGPGSFTGVRIGVSCVNAMAYALDRLVVPVNAMEALYETAAGDSGRVLTILDANNGNAYAAVFEGGAAIVPPTPVETTPFLSLYGQGARIIGDVGVSPCVYPKAKFVGAAAFRLRQTAVQAAMPCYLRPSQAERLHKSVKEETGRG